MQHRFDLVRASRRAPALAGAGLALFLLVPGMAAAQDPASSDVLVTPTEAAGECGTVTVSSRVPDGSPSVQVIGEGTCEPPILVQHPAAPAFSVGGSTFNVDPFGAGEPFLAGGPLVVSGGMVIRGEPGLPGVVTVAADPARTVGVTAVDGTAVTLETDDGWTRTVDTANVAITLDADTLGASDLEPGDRVQVIQVRNANDTYTITGLALVLPDATGTVSGVAETGFTVTEPDGTEIAVVVTDETRWPTMGVRGMPGMSGMPGVDGAPGGGREALTDGDLVHVRGTLAEDGTMTATEVFVMGNPWVIGDPAMPVPGDPAPVEPAPQEPAPQQPAPQEPAPSPAASPAA